MPLKENNYYGCKLHALTARRDGIIPFPESLMITPSEDKMIWRFLNQAWGEQIYGKTIFADKYIPTSNTLTSRKRNLSKLKCSLPWKQSKDNVKNSNKLTGLLITYSLRLLKSETTHWVLLQLAKWKNNYSRSDESQIYYRIVSPHFRKVGYSFLVSYFLTQDSHK